MKTRRSNLNHIQPYKTKKQACSQQSKKHYQLKMSTAVKANKAKANVVTPSQKTDPIDTAVALTKINFQ